MSIFTFEDFEGDGLALEVVLVDVAKRAVGDRGDGHGRKIRLGDSQRDQLLRGVDFALVLHCFSVGFFFFFGFFVGSSQALKIEIFFFLWFLIHLSNQSSRTTTTNQSRASEMLAWNLAGNSFLGFSFVRWVFIWTLSDSKLIRI